MLETFTHDTFAPRIGEPFVIHLDDGSAVETRLSEAQVFGRQAQEGGRSAFSLLFHGPAHPVLPQRIYRMENEGLGAFELFLVPLGPDGRGMRYEAVFT
ncbi:MAG TPA: hypothetical protein VF263_24465 [Longimicrobiaceae bacterium]